MRFVNRILTFKHQARLAKATIFIQYLTVGIVLNLKKHSAVKIYFSKLHWSQWVQGDCFSPRIDLTEDFFSSFPNSVKT